MLQVRARRWGEQPPVRCRSLEQWRSGTLAPSLAGQSQAVLDCEPDQGRHVAHAEFLHQPAAVGLDRFGRKVIGCCNLGAGVSLDHQLQHLALARAQAVQRTRTAGSAKDVLSSSAGTCSAGTGLLNR